MIHLRRLSAERQEKGIEGGSERINHGGNGNFVCHESLLMCVQIYVKVCTVEPSFPHLCAREATSTHAFPSQPQKGSLAKTQS